MTELEYPIITNLLDSTLSIAQLQNNDTTTTSKAIENNENISACIFLILPLLK